MEAAAHSAKRAAWLSFGAVAIGTALLIWNLALMRGANKSARDAVAITDRMGRAQARAYVDVIGAKLHDTTVDLSVRITLRNEGLTPAKEIVVYGATAVVDVRLPIEPPPFSGLIEATPWGSLRSTGETTVPLPCEETADHYEAVIDAHGPLSIMAFGRVRYVTIFDETYETEFVFHTNRAKHLLKSGPDKTIVEDPLVMWRAPGSIRTYQPVDDAGKSQ